MNTQKYTQFINKGNKSSNAMENNPIHNFMDELSEVFMNEEHLFELLGASCMTMEMKYDKNTMTLCLTNGKKYDLKMTEKT